MWRSCPASPHRPPTQQPNPTLTLARNRQLSTGPRALQKVPRAAFARLSPRVRQAFVCAKNKCGGFTSQSEGRPAGIRCRCVLQKKVGSPHKTRVPTVSMPFPGGGGGQNFVFAELASVRLSPDRSAVVPKRCLLDSNGRGKHSRSHEKTAKRITYRPMSNM